MEIPSKKDEAKPTQTRAVGKPPRRLRYRIFRLPEPHDRMPLEEVLEWKKQAQITDHPEDWIRVACCVGRGVGKVPPDSKERDDILSRPKVGQWASQNIHQSRWAAYAMGIILLYGVGEYNKDDVASKDAFEVGYRMKCPQCTSCLAICYRNGDGVEKDDTRAVEILHEAISYGSLWAKLILGYFYEEGRGAEQDCCKAFQLFSDVAEYLLFGVQEKARCFEEGIGVDKDLQKAKDLYQQASDAGYHEATLKLASLLLDGPPEDKKNGVAILEQGVQGGDAKCTRCLGALYLKGDGVPMDDIKAYSLFQKAAGLGDAKGYFFMAACNDRGWGVLRNECRAVELYEKAAAWQDAEAMGVLGLSYVAGLLGLSQDISRGLDWLRCAAQKNDATAICYLGLLYMDGDVVPKDENKGYSLFQEAARLGDAQAYLFMAQCNDGGHGVPRNENLAVELYEKAAALHNADAMSVLGISYVQGLKGLSMDLSIGLEWLQRAAQKDNAEAILFLGGLYMNGEVVPSDENKGYSLFEQAASLGDSEAYFLIAECNEKGHGVPRDERRAIEMYEKAAALQNANAMRVLGISYVQGIRGLSQDVSRGLDWLQRAARKNDAETFRLLGVFYMNGEVVPRDESKGYSLFEQAARLGDSEAYFLIAECNEKGHGVPRDERRAIEMYEKAAALQDAKAMRVLGMSYVDGLRGLSQDVSRGLDWLQHASQKNDARALLYLGASYLDGDIVPKDENKGYSLLQQAASLGDAQAYFVMADCSEKGRGVPQDECHAVELYEKAAALQNADAMSVLGISYVQGIRGLSQDVSKGLEWLQRAAQKDNAQAILFLGGLYIVGGVVPKDENKGYSLLQQAASLGDAKAYFLMAKCNDEGHGVPLNENLAVELYEKAAALQNADAMRVLGISYVQGLKGLSMDLSIGLEWLQRAAQKDNAEAILFLGALYISGDFVPMDESKGYSLFEQAASLGDSEAYVLIAECNEKGHGVPRDERRAIEMYEKAAALQNANAMRVLGMSYVSGIRGLSQDVSKGLEWLQRAAQKNDARAIRSLGGLYMNGDFVPKDESKGYSLLQRAASLGDERAYFNMAQCNDKGLGVPRDERRAVELFEKAAALQNADAMRVLGISYVKGIRGLSQDVPRGLDWLQRAAQKNDADAFRLLGVLYLNGEVVPIDENKGYSLFEQAARLGDSEAYFLMAESNDRGRGLPRNERRAIEFYEKAAALQDAAAMRVLGMSYVDGLRGLLQDVSKGLGLLQRAAEKNDPAAIRFLGDHYASLHVWQKALSFYEKGLELGDHECMENLARLYATGNGVSRNDDRALELYLQFAGRYGNTNDLISPAFGYIYALYGLPQNYEMAFKLHRKAAAMGSVVAINRLAWHHRSGCGVPVSIPMATWLLHEAIQKFTYPYSLFLAVDILASSAEVTDLQQVRAVVEKMPNCGDLNVRARWFLPFVDTQLNAFKSNQFDWLGELRPDFVSDSDVQVIARIGWGQFGNVFLACLRQERWVAVKFMNIDLVEQKAWATTHVLHERFTCRVLEKQNIPHVVKYIGFVDDLGNSQRGLIFDLCADIRSVEEEAKARAENFVSVRFADLKSVPDWSKRVQSSLRSMVVHPGFRHFSVADVLSMLAKVADALSAIHKLGYLHRDIADRNVLCDHHGNVQLADFGLAKYVGRGVNSYDEDDPINKYAKNMTPGHPYAVAWWPPECVGTGRYKAIFSVSSDVYSFGVLIWQCFTGHDPFDEVEARSSDVADREAAAQEIIRKIQDLETPDMDLLYPDTPEGLSDLLERCWLSDPDRRPSMADVAAELRRIYAQPVSSRGHAQTITSWNDATSKWFDFQTYWDIPMEELRNHIRNSTSDSPESTYTEKVLIQRLSEMKHINSLQQRPLTMQSFQNFIQNGDPSTCSLYTLAMRNHLR